MSNFTYLLRVRYSECDAQSVVFNGKYAEYVDVAATEYTRVIWGDYTQLLAKGIDNQVVSLKIDWQAPAHFDEVLSISVRTGKVGNSSYSLILDFSNHATAQAIAKAEIVYVQVSVDEHKKMSIADDLRAKLHKEREDIVIDHAGVI